MVGNSLEVAESIACLHGNGPDDLKDLTIKLGNMFVYFINRKSEKKE